jgi:hypothetical protein
MRYLILICCCGFGLGALFGSVFWAQNRLELKNTGLRTQGTVIGHNTHVNSSPEENRRSSTIRYTERVEFTDLGGQQIIFVSNTSSSSPIYRVGEQVEVIYPKANPKSALIYSFSSFWGGPVVLLCFGVAFSLMGPIAFFQIGRIDSALDTPFFMHNKKNPGRFRRIDAVVAEVGVHNLDGKEAISFRLVGKDPQTGKRLEWNIPPKTYTLNHVSLNRAYADKILNKTLPLTYDPENLDNFHVDVFRKSIPRRVA